MICTFSFVIRDVFPLICNWVVPSTYRQLTIRCLGHLADSTQLRELFVSADQNADGLITYTEFTGALSILTSTTASIQTTESVKDVFKFLDKGIC